MTGRIVIAFLALGAWIAGSTLGAVGRPQPAEARPLFQIGAAHADYVPAIDGSDPIFILFLGSDARPGEPVDGARTDSIHLVGINPAKHRAAVVGFPRDSWVEVPGLGSQKINTALFYGGPDLVVATVENLTGIRIDYWALTSFDGIKAMVNGVGGLVVDVPLPMYDSSSGSNFDPGRQRLDGQGVLSFSRDRHSLPTGDFGRSENQGQVVVAALAKFRKEFASDPSRLFTWVAAGLRNVQTAVPLDRVLSLAFTCTTIDPERVENIVVPGTTGSAGGSSVVLLSSQAQAIFADMQADGLVATKNLPPSPNGLRD
ncbi:MAG TPA: LCP family protein [Actinomycetota bacterium]|nr:LCP family protein [Actinomycetota bacterium]